MRSALRSLVSEYDPTVVDRNLLASLAVSGAADLGAELADSLPQSEASVLTACHAAAANWGRAADSTMSEFQRSIHYPKYGPRVLLRFDLLLAACLRWAWHASAGPRPKEARCGRR